MATTMYAQISQTHPGAGPFLTYRDMTVARGAAVSNIGFSLLVNGEYAMSQTAPSVVRFYSERVSAQVTISGAVTFNLWATRNVTTFAGRLRARLYKITAGGSDVETLILTADAAADISGTAGTSVLYNFSGTPATAVTLAANERLICKVTAVLSSGSLTGFNLQLDFGSATASVKGDTWVALTETVTMLPNDNVRLFLRRTAVAGIGDFLDMLTTRGSSAATTGVVNTVAGGTDIEWTRTPGGLPLKWISPRLKTGWTASSTNYFGPCAAYAQESATTANAAMVEFLYKRRVDGTEVLLGTVILSAELTTSATKYGDPTITSLVSTPELNIREDERLIVTVRLTNAPGQTMAGSRTATFTYDHNVADGVGDCYITLYDAPQFKLETDPSASGAVTNGGMLGGVSNG